MKRILSSPLIFAALVMLFWQPVSAQDDSHEGQKAEYNLEGVFQCDWNGKYYVRQIGNEILWFGEDDNVTPTWSNVAHGTISGNMINVIWGDVPKGNIMQNGKLVLKIISNDSFEKISQEGDNFGSTVWTRSTQ